MFDFSFLDVVDFCIARAVAAGMWQAFVMLISLPVSKIVIIGVVVALMCVCIKMMQNLFKQ